MEEKDAIREVELIMKGLTLGAALTREKVIAEICPECPFKTPFCQWLVEKVWPPGEKARFVCKGMRAWVTKGN